MANGQLRASWLPVFLVCWWQCVGRRHLKCFCCFSVADIIRHVKPVWLQKLQVQALPPEAAFRMGLSTGPLNGDSNVAEGVNIGMSDAWCHHQ